jgi:hypothetical protein
MFGIEVKRFWHSYWGYVICKFLGHAKADMLPEKGNEHCDCGARHAYRGCSRCRSAIDPEGGGSDGAEQA